MLFTAYIGENDIARRITKAYVGDSNGIARCMYNPVLYTEASLTRSTATSLPAAKYGMGAATIGGYALFAGGVSKNDTIANNVVTYYNSSLSKGSATSLSYARRSLSGASNETYAIFACGYGPSKYGSGGTQCNDVDAYNSSLVRTTATTSIDTSERASASIGDYAVFSGGDGYSYLTYVDYYTSTLTHSYASNLTYGRQYHDGATVGNYIIFAGGMHYIVINGQGSSSTIDVVEVYNSNLVKTSCDPLTIGRQKLAATSVGNYALFAGGSYYNHPNSPTYISKNTVDVYNTNLVHSNATVLSQARERLGGASTNEYAIFVGGYVYSDINQRSSIVDVYTDKLIKSTAANITATDYITPLSFNEYALFAGGRTESNYSSTVYAYLANSASYK